MSTLKGNVVILMLLVSVALSLRNSIDGFSSSSKNPHISTGFRHIHRAGVLSMKEINETSKLEYDHYRGICPQAEEVVRSTMATIFAQQRDAPPALLRLLFHDCFIQGCDASVLLLNSNNNFLVERDAVPNQTLRGFDLIDKIKEELEKTCPGVVSCADILVLATRDGILLAGGPFYPVFTGRRDSTESYFNEAMAEIPKPDDNITRILNQFGSRGFNERETVALLGGHNIGKIGCQFIRDRLGNFQGTGRPDPSVGSDFLDEMRSNCQDSNGSTSSDNRFHLLVAEPTLGAMSCHQELLSSIASGGAFDSHYYERLLEGRGLLYADQQLMATDRTADLVSSYASDEGSTFRRDFAKVMVKMSSLGVLTGSEGHIRLNCTVSVPSSLGS